MKLLPWLSQSSDLNPIENEWGELKRSTTNMEMESELILYEGMISDLLSGVLQNHQTLQEKTQSCYVGKRTLE